MAASTIVQGYTIALDVLIDPTSLLLIFIAVLFGMFIGVLPGLGGTVVLALLVPITFGLEPLVAIMVLVAANGGTSQAGSITAILINTPGTAPNAATLLDGYPLARKGEAGRAILASVVASASGAVLGLLVLTLSIPIMLEIVLLFGFAEIFWLGIWGLSVVSVVVRGSVLKGLISGVIGLLFAAHGLNFMTATYRWDYGLTFMQDGVKFVPFLVGIFALAEMINLVARGETISREEVADVIGNKWQGVRDVITHKWLFLRSAVTGIVIGMIPGVGGVTANYVAYFQAAQTSDNPESFGTGDIRGVIASEASNDGKEGGAYLPTLAFGIPGSASMAILMGAFLIHGILPGPTLLRNELDLVFIVIFAALISNIMSSIVGGLTVDYLVKITRIDSNLFAGIIVAWGFYAAFALNNNIFDLYIALLGALVGFAMMRLGMSRVPIILGMVLGPVIERSYWQSLQVSGGDYAVFVRSPITIILILLVFLSIFYPLLKPLIKRQLAEMGVTGRG